MDDNHLPDNQGIVNRNSLAAVILNRLDKCIDIAKENAERVFRVECGGTAGNEDKDKKPLGDFTAIANEKLDTLTEILEETRATLRRFI